MTPIKIGEINNAVIETLGLSISPGTPIYIGKSNIDHMKSKHESDYEKYNIYINHIISCPDFVGINPKDNSIEYVKEFSVDNEYVKIAVRVSVSGKYYVRSLYRLNNQRVLNFISKNTLKPLTIKNE